MSQTLQLTETCSYDSTPVQDHALSKIDWETVAYIPRRDDLTEESLTSMLKSKEDDPIVPSQFKHEKTRYRGVKALSQYSPACRAFVELPPALKQRISSMKTDLSMLKRTLATYKTIATEANGETSDTLSAVLSKKLKEGRHVEIASIYPSLCSLTEESVMLLRAANGSCKPRFENEDFSELRVALDDAQSTYKPFDGPQMQAALKLSDELSKVRLFDELLANQSGVAALERGSEVLSTLNSLVTSNWNEDSKYAFAGLDMLLAARRDFPAAATYLNHGQMSQAVAELVSHRGHGTALALSLVTRAETFADLEQTGKPTMTQILSYLHQTYKDAVLRQADDPIAYTFERCFSAVASMSVDKTADTSETAGIKTTVETAGSSDLKSNSETEDIATTAETADSSSLKSDSEQGSESASTVKVASSSGLASTAATDTTATPCGVTEALTGVPHEGWLGKLSSAFTNYTKYSKK